MKLRGLHHVNIKVQDFDKALEFYESTLGLSQRTDRPIGVDPGAWFDLGPNQIHLSVGKPPAENGQHFAIEVEDLPELLSDLERAGVPARLGSRGTATIADPGGNLIELRPPE